MDTVGFQTVACHGAGGPSPGTRARRRRWFGPLPPPCVLCDGWALRSCFPRVPLREPARGDGPAAGWGDAGDRLAGTARFEFSKERATEEPVGKREAGQGVMGGGPVGIVSG